MRVDVSYKIKPVAEIGEVLKSRGERVVVHCHGEFDLLHFGHTRYFKAAKKFGDILVVTLTPDKFIAKGPGRPVFNEQQRAESIANLEFVDYVGINEWPTAMETLEAIKPDVYCKGNEYQKKKDVTGRLDQEREKIESLGGRMEFTDDIVFSSSKLLNNHFNVFSQEVQPLLKELSASFEAKDILNKLEEISNLKVLMLGEVAVEEIVLIEGEGAEPKEVQRYFQPMGALMGATLLKEFGAEIDLVGLSGPHAELSQPWIPGNCFADFIVSEAYQPIKQTTYYDKETGYQRFKIRRQHPFEPSEELEGKVLSRLAKSLKKYDLVLVFDQGLGFFYEEYKKALENAPNLALTLTPEAVSGGLSEYKGWDFCLLSAEERGLRSIQGWVRHRKRFLKDKQLGFVDSSNRTTFAENGEFVEIAPLIPVEKKNYSLDLISASFALHAGARKIGLDPKLQKLLVPAVAALSEKAGVKPFELEKMLFDKFIITLLNR